MPTDQIEMKTGFEFLDCLRIQLLAQPVQNKNRIKTGFDYDHLSSCPAHTPCRLESKDMNTQNSPRFSHQAYRLVSSFRTTPK